MLLKSLDVRSFRAFKELAVERFGRVNLFVGRNNSGKTSLLEALRLYAARGNLRVLLDILASRGEIDTRVTRHLDESDVERTLEGALQLFHGRQTSDVERRSFSIGPVQDAGRTLTVSIHWLTSELEDSAQLRLVGGEDLEMSTTQLRPALRVVYGDSSEIIPLDQIDRRQLLYRSRSEAEHFKSARSVYVSAHGISEAQIGSLWDAIALTGLEDEVTRALAIVSPEIERLSLVAGRTGARVVVAKVAGIPRPLPLKSFGDGVNRMLGVALALVNAQGGALLIDEVENGLHYSVQGEVWELVFRLAINLDVQVFATTHSWDCITAFQQAAMFDPYEEASLIRLEADDYGCVSATVFSEDEVAIATRQQIEVR